jgi:HEAT repeat protein
MDAMIAKPRTRRAELPAEKLEAAWVSLSGESRQAFKALLALTASPDGTVAFLGKRLKATVFDAERVKKDAEKVKKLVAALDSDNFNTRNQAAKELKKLGALAVPALKKAFAEKPSLEVVRQIKGLLADAAAKPGPSPEVLRELRAIEVLESIGTPAARDLLQSVAKGTKKVLTTIAAQEALDRMGK